MIFWLTVRKKYDYVKMRHDEITFLCEEVCRQADFKTVTLLAMYYFNYAGELKSQSFHDMFCFLPCLLPASDVWC